MPSSFSPSLRLELIAPGEQAGTWGTTTNTNLGTLLESSVAGFQTVSVIAADQALTIADGAADQSRSAMLRFTTTTGAAFNVYAPPVSKQYLVFNDSVHAATLFNSTSPGNTIAAGGGIVVPAGKTLAVYSNGTVFKTIDAAALTGVLPIADGGTGATTAAGARTNLGTVNDPGTNGILVRTAANTTTPRSVAVSGTGLSVTNGDGVAGNPTVTSNATSANTNSTIVARDASGNFSAGTITATLSGNASTATALQNARTIGGVSFNGTANIDLPGVNTTGNQNTTGSAATLTTTRTLWGQNFNGSANVSGALSAVTTLAMSGQLTNTVTTGTAPLVVSSTTRVSNLNVATAGTADILTTARLIGGVSFDGSANINLPGVNAAGNQNTTGNAATSTALQTARTIGGVSFDGTANISLPGVNTAGNQNTTGNAATATALQTARTIGGVSFNGTANINLPGVNTAGNQNTTGTAANITGTAAVVNGGTGRTTLTSNNVVLGAGTSAVNFVAPGTSGNVLTSNGTTWTSASGSGYKQVVFTSSGTWTKPAGLKEVKITVVGGGGGGGLTNDTSVSVGSGGGGGGGASIRVLAAASVGATETVTVGSGGASDTAGGTSSFGSLASATGGQPGENSTAFAGGTNFNNGGVGGVGSSGDINIKGGGGGFGVGMSTSGANGSVGGSGGSSILGGGAISKGIFPGLAASGDNGGLYGGGGGGAGARSNSTLISGGAGAAGIVIVEEFY